MHINGSVITTRRSEYNVSQEVLHRKTGVSVSTLSRLEKGKNVGFISVLKVLKALDLSIEDVVVINTPSVDAEIMSELDKVRNQGSYYLIEKILNKLSVPDWRSSKRLSVYYDWHQAIISERAKKFNEAINYLDKALKLIDDKNSLEPLKIELFMAKGNVLNKSGKNGLDCYVKAGNIYSRHSNKMLYKTGVKLYYNVMINYCRRGDYGKVEPYVIKAKLLLAKHESTFMLAEIVNMHNLAKRKLDEP